MTGCERRGLQDNTIIYFGGFNRYNFLSFWQRTQEVACWLATNNRLIYIEHLPFNNEGWLVYIYNLMRRVVGPKRSECHIKNLEFFFPMIVPLPEFGIIRRLNRYLIDRQIQRLLRRSPDNSSQVIWINWLSPYAYDYAQGSSAFTIYDCIQNYQSLAYPPEIRKLDNLLAERADLVFSDALTNYSEKLKTNRSVHYVPQGVSTDWISVKTTDMPDDMQSLKRPILGYVGAFHRAFDYELFSDIARSKPEWTFVIVGKPNKKAQELANLKNVVLLGTKLHDELPDYISHFDVALIPYVMNDLTEGVFPTKLFEYLCFGKPVVSTFLPSLTEYKQFVRFAFDAEGFIKECESALEDDDPSRRARIEIAGENTWSKRFEDMTAILYDTIVIYYSKNGNKDVEAA
ncbi:MAG TPA: glycosyltransferase [Candidatus Aquicultor sp.]|jgi:glycosyltransferase involved in cell wall biosynthesis